MKSIGLNEQQLQQMKTHPGFIAGSKRWEHARRTASLRNQKRRVVQRGRNVCDRAPDAHAHDYQPRLHRRMDYWRHPVQEHDGQGYSWATYG